MSRFKGDFNDFVQDNELTVRVIFNFTDAAAGNDDFYLIDYVYMNISFFNESAIQSCQNFDITKPTVAQIKPVASSTYNASDPINISAYAGDDTSLSSVLAFVTLPNGTQRNYSMVNLTQNNLYNVSFTDTTLVGQYNVSFFVNDSWNNVNASLTTYFSVILAQTAINVTLSAGNPEIYSPYSLFANYSHTGGDILSSALCILYGNYSRFTGRFHLASSGDTSLDDSIWGNRSHRVDIQNISTNQTSYQVVLQVRKVAFPLANLSIYLRCDGGTTFSAAHRIGQFTPSNISHSPFYQPAFVSFPTTILTS